MGCVYARRHAWGVSSMGGRLAGDLGESSPRSEQAIQKRSSLLAGGGFHVLPRSRQTS